MSVAVEVVEKLDNSFFYYYYYYFPGPSLTVRIRKGVEKSAEAI
jgi:hypothetical protein